MKRLNQYTSRTVPGLVNILGAAAHTATVSVNDRWATRQGDYFWAEVLVANTSGPVYLAVTNLAVSHDGSPPHRVTNWTGQVFVPQTPEAFAYDEDGNLTNDGRWVYTWDGENRLVKQESLGGAPTASKLKLEFQYDSQGRRIQKLVSTNNGSVYVAQCTNRFVYDGWNLVAILDPQSSVLQAYLWGLDLSGSLQGAGGVGGLLAITDASQGSHFCAYDGNGNVTALVKADGAGLTAQYEYGPFGELLRATGPMARANPFRFATKYQDDESDLIYYGYRYYNPNTGRWSSRDPIGERGGYNLCAFVDNRPPNAVDRLGLSLIPEIPGPIIAPPDPCALFEAWYQGEKKNLDWLKELPNCPCSVKVKKRCLTAGGPFPAAINLYELEEVSSDKDAGWKLDPEIVVQVTRKGVAAYCIRSRASNSGGKQECCYDSKGKLITGGRGAGTSDRGGGLISHMGKDFTPFALASACDKQKGGSSCVLKYLEVRPVNNGNNCDRNEPPE